MSRLKNPARYRSRNATKNAKATADVRVSRRVPSLGAIPEDDDEEPGGEDVREREVGGELPLDLRERDEQDRREEQHVDRRLDEDALARADTGGKSVSRHERAEGTGSVARVVLESRMQIDALRLADHLVTDLLVRNVPEYHYPPTTAVGRRLRTDKSRRDDSVA